MLRKLTIQNYAIIEHIEMDLSGSLNIITGETGAGKSILLGALSLILGQRADSKALFRGEKKCVVEGQFDIDGYNLKAFFETEDLDYETTTIIRREITASGKSRAFVNDTPVNLGILKELGKYLINLHSQHETLALSSASFQLELVDTIAGNQEALNRYNQIFHRYQNIRQQLSQLRNTFEEENGDIDYLQYQYDELANTDLDATAFREMETELKTLEHAEEIKEQLSRMLDTLNTSDYSLLNQVDNVQQALRQIEGFHNNFPELGSRLESVSIELADLNRELENIQSNTEVDPERLQEVTGHLNEINRLLNKHRKQEVSELIELKEELASKISSFDTIKEDIQQLEEALLTEQEALEKQAEVLRTGRQQAAPKIKEAVCKQLSIVGLPNASLEVIIEPLPLEKMTPAGLDKVSFLFSANPGSVPEELRKVASGGELSRLMLVLKSLLASNAQLPTLIFDEIDTGISGEVALKVGRLMEDLSKHHQLVAITHLPQIAGKGDSHFYVYKDVGQGQTFTKIKTLNEDERLVEIAKMLGGDKVTDAALENAKELLLN